MHARQGRKNPANIYLVDSNWDYDVSLVQAHTKESAKFIVNSINYYLEKDKISAIQGTRIVINLPAVEKLDNEG